MSLFKKPKRNFRQRNTKHDSDEENNGGADLFKSRGTSGIREIESPQSATDGKTSDTRKEKTPRPTGLSFDNESDGEETEVFKIKKSSYSRHLMKQVDKPKKKEDDECANNDGGEDKVEENVSDVNTANTARQKIMNDEDVEEMDPDSCDEGDEKSSDPFGKILENRTEFVDDDSANDEELERWELEQIRKGVIIPQVPLNNSYSSHKRIEPPIPATKKYTQSLKSCRKDLLVRWESCRQVFRARERDRSEIENDLALHKNVLLELDESAASVLRAFTFYREMRGYVTDFVECLDLKMEKIVELEKSFNRLLKQRAQKLVERSQQDVKDQSDEFMALISNVKNATYSLNRIPANTRRAAEREGRRARRRCARESRSPKLVHYEGMSSDDEENGNQLLDEANHLFDDVVEDYYVIKVVQNRFKNWKEKYPESYKNAKVGLCMPKVFAPFVRWRLISWNPLEDSLDLDEFAWFEPLMFYGYNEKLQDDTDLSIIPSIVERIILPRLTELADSVWNPVSTSQTLRLASLVRRLINEYPLVNGKNKKTVALLETVVKRMRRTLDEDVYVPPYPKALLENKSSGANVFFQRQYWTCVKILRNFLSWQGILSDEILQEVARDGLLTRYILWAVNISPFGEDSLEKAKMITAAIPRCWFVKRENNATIPLLEKFCNLTIN